MSGETENLAMSEQDKKDILEMDEPTTYFLINECGNFMFRMNHELAHDKIPESTQTAVISDINNIRIIQKFAAVNLGRFGVNPESVNDGEKGEYWKWYSFWDKWKNDLTDDEWKDVATGNYKPYLPKTSWKDETTSETKE
jgi:hypothetical protein